MWLEVIDAPEEGLILRVWTLPTSTIQEVARPSTSPPFLTTSEGP